MHHLIPFLLLSITTTTTLIAQETVWDRTIIGDDTESAVDAVVLAGGDVLILGSYSGDNAARDTVQGMELVRVTSDGAVRWARRPEIAGRITPLALFDQGDGTLTVIGWHEMSDEIEGDERAWIGRIDTGGSLFSSAPLISPAMRVEHVRRVDDGGYLIGGRYGRDAFLLRLRADLSIRWSQRYIGSRDSIRSIALAPSIEANGADEFLLVLNRDTAAPIASFIIGVDSLGVSQWGHTIDAITFDGWRDIAPTLDGGFVVVGTMMNPMRNRNGWLGVVKIDEDRSEGWSVTLPLFVDGDDSNGVNKPFGIVADPDGGLLIHGVTGPDLTLPFILTLSADGTIEHRYLHGIVSFAEKRARRVVRLADGGFLLVGTMMREMWMARIGEIESSDVDVEREQVDRIDLSVAFPESPRGAP